MTRPTQGVAKSSSDPLTRVDGVRVRVVLHLADGEDGLVGGAPGVPGLVPHVGRQTVRSAGERGGVLAGREGRLPQVVGLPGAKGVSLRLWDFLTPVAVSSKLGTAFE